MNNANHTSVNSDAQQKVCNKCRVSKLLSCFSADQRLSGGLQGICKDCRLQYQKSKYTHKKKTFPDGVQKCSQCDKIKPLDDFSRDKRRPLGRGSGCLNCENARTYRHHRKNPEKRRESDQKYRIGNAEQRRKYNQQYRKNHPHIKQQAEQRRRARKQNVATGPKPTLKERLKMQGGMCALCKVNGDQNWEYDHIIPLSRNGSDTADNMEVLCSPCNRKKAARMPLEFAHEQGRLL